MHSLVILLISICGTSTRGYEYHLRWAMWPRFDLTHGELARLCRKAGKPEYVNHIRSYYDNLRKQLFQKSDWFTERLRAARLMRAKGLTARQIFRISSTPVQWFQKQMWQGPSNEMTRGIFTSQRDGATIPSSRGELSETCMYVGGESPQVVVILFSILNPG